MRPILRMRAPIVENYNSNQGMTSMTQLLQKKVTHNHELVVDDVQGHVDDPPSPNQSNRGPHQAPVTAVEGGAPPNVLVVVKGSDSPNLM
ncbi:hypothetical protein QJS10_CPB13g01492 [Acorus calamus]|uniref:Uncharacterized protein n=1 Tax=Acorus calamus TaxID=4465 RepID=A0AAV9DGS2_ACOCL|nr:hypothetical protein QJS10_CPB13g01492 [Acorus calamus]